MATTHGHAMDGVDCGMEERQEPVLFALHGITPSRLSMAGVAMVTEDRQGRNSVRKGGRCPPQVKRDGPEGGEHGG